MSAPVSTLTGWVVLPDGRVCDPTSVEVSLDAEWAPYVSATVVLPLDASLIAGFASDALATSRLRVGIRRSWYAAPTLGDLSEAWAGLTLADLTTEWAGLTLGDVDTGWSTVWEAGMRQPDMLQVELAVREVSVDSAAGTITIRLAGDELVAQDMRVVTSRPAEPLDARITALLSAAGITVKASSLALGGPTHVNLAAAEIDMTKSVWEWCSDPATAAGLRLWVDVDGTWRLTDPTAAPASTLILDRFEDAVDDTDRDGEFADVYAVTVHWTDLSGNPIAETRTWPNPVLAGPRRFHHDEVTYDTVSATWPIQAPTTNELMARQARYARAWRTQRLTVVADPTARPGMASRTPDPVVGGAWHTKGIVTGITFNVPADTMTVTAKNVIGGQI